MEDKTAIEIEHVEIEMQPLKSPHSILYVATEESKEGEVMSMQSKENDIKEEEVISIQSKGDDSKEGEVISIHSKGDKSERKRGKNTSVKIQKEEIKKLEDEKKSEKSEIQ